MPINCGTRVGADLRYHDDHVTDLPGMGLAASSFEDALDGADLAVIITAHPSVDHDAIAERVPVLDFRGVTRHRIAERAAAAAGDA